MPRCRRCPTRSHPTSPLSTPTHTNTATLNDGGSATTLVTISPALPDGLDIDSGDCNIGGVPTTPASLRTYTVTATNGAGNKTATVTLGVDPDVPGLSYSSGAFNFDTGASVTINASLATHGAAVTACTSVPALPAGLTLSNTTCDISGTVANGASTATYTVTATNLKGSSAGASFVLTITDVTAPTVTDITASNTAGTYKAGDTIHVQVVFSEPVTIGGAGAPQVQLHLNDTDPQISYASGSGSTTLVFNYVVGATDNVDTLDVTLVTDFPSLSDSSGIPAANSVPSSG